MRILAIDSSAGAASAAIWEDGSLLGEFFTNTRLTHSQTLMPMIGGVLDCARVPLESIDLFAVSAGPGSFTGVRIGVASIKGLAMAQGKPCAGVSTLEAMARNLKMDAGSLLIDGLAIDPITREVALDGRRLDLTPREFDLLYFFARQPGKVFSRMDLLNAVWGYSHEGSEHTVNTHINRLRAKIEADPAQPVRILTVWGRGYKFATGEEPQP